MCAAEAIKSEGYASFADALRRNTRVQRLEWHHGDRVRRWSLSYPGGSAPPVLQWKEALTTMQNVLRTRTLRYLKLESEWTLPLLLICC